MPQFDQLHFKRTLTRAVVLPLVAMALLAGVLFWQLNALLVITQLADHSDQVLAQANDVRRLLVDRETGLRGYLIIGEPDFLEPYNQSQQLIGPAIDQLAALIADDPVQSDRLNQLRPNYDRWQAFALNVQELHDRGGDYQTLMRSRVGKQLMDAMRAQMIEFVSAEEQLRDTRSQNAQQAAQITIATVLGLALLAGIGLALGTRRQLLALSHSYGRALTVAHEQGAALYEQRERLQVTLASIGDAVLVTDPRGRLTFLNQVAQALTGWDAENALGQPIEQVFQIIEAETHAPLASPLAQVLEQNRVISLAQKTLLVRRDGATLPIDDSAAPIKAENGAALGMVLVFHDTSERNQIEIEQARLTRQIEEQSRRLSNVIANVPGLVWEAWGQPDAETQHIDFVSDYVERMLGYSVAEWTSTPNFWLKIVHPDDQARAVQAAKETFESRNPGVNQFRWVRRDGRVIWVESFSVAICDEAGQPVGMRGVTIDITARKQAEEERALLNRNMRLLLDSTGEGIYGIGLNGVCTFINTSAAAQLGYAPEQLIGQNMHSLFHSARADGSAYPEEECPIYQALGAAKQCHVEDEVFWRRDRTPFAVAYSAYPIVDNGVITGGVVTFSAITERKRSQERQQFLIEASGLLASSLEYQVILERLAELIVPRLADWSAIHILEDDGAVHRLAIAHTDPAKANLARNRAERYPLQPSAKHIVAKVLATGAAEFYPNVPDDLLVEAARDTEHLKLLRDLGFTSYICAPLLARGRTLGALTLVTATSGRHYDPSDLALAEDLAGRTAIAVDNARLYHKAQEAVRARDQFLSIASHELKTPLTSLIGYTGLIQRRASRDGGLPERDQRAIRIVSEQALRLNKLVTALLDLSRIETGQLSIDHGVVELNALAQRLVEETLQAQPYATEQVLFQAAREPLVLIGDEVRLEQVIQNLIQNALKYSPAGGAVTVWLDRHDDIGCLHVRDQGIGIPAAALPNLFKRFYRAPNVEEHQIGGMGIGLFVVKEIVQLHGGTISVESQEGVGSTFTVCLPLRPEPRAPGAEIAVAGRALAESA